MGAFERDTDEQDRDEEYVPYQKPMNRFERMALQDRGGLMALVQSGSLDDNDLGQALQAVGDLPGDKATMLIAEHFQHPDADVRASAVAGLERKLKDGGYVNPQILQVLKPKLARLVIGAPHAMVIDKPARRF